MYDAIQLKQPTLNEILTPLVFRISKKFSFFLIVLCKDDFLRKTMAHYSYLNIDLKTNYENL